MGVEYFVACEDCRRRRNLDMFYTLHRKAGTRQEVEALADEIMGSEGRAYRCALLTSFLADHFGHRCVVLTEFDLLDEFQRVEDYPDDEDIFWPVPNANA